MSDLTTTLTQIIHKASRAYNGQQVVELVAEIEQAFADADYVRCIGLKEFESDPKRFGLPTSPDKSFTLAKDRAWELDVFAEADTVPIQFKNILFAMAAAKYMQARRLK